MLTEADILWDIVEPGTPGLPPAAAESLLQLSFRETTQDRIRELLDKNNRGVITPDEAADLQKYIRVGQMLDLLQAKARLSLAKPAGES